MARDSGNVRVTFSERTLVRFKGVFLLLRFLTRLALKKPLKRAIHFPRRNARYSVGDLLLALIYSMLLGLERLESTHLFTRSGVFQYLTKLPTYPNATTLSRSLLQLGRTALPNSRRLHERYRALVAAFEGQHRFVFDLDSAMVVLYGHQEQA